MLDMDGAVGAHGEGGAQGFLRGGGASGHDDDFGGGTLFPFTDGFFDRDFAEGVHRHFEVGGFHARTVSLHPDGDVGVDNAFYGDQYLHCRAVPDLMDYKNGLFNRILGGVARR
jgi:hypothetical protein